MSEEEKISNGGEEIGGGVSPEGADRDGEQVKKTKRRVVRPKSPKPRAHYPSGGTVGTDESSETGAPKKSPVRRKGILPSNPDRTGGAKLPSNPTRGRSSSPKKECGVRNVASPTLSAINKETNNGVPPSRDKPPTSPKRRTGDASPEDSKKTEKSRARSPKQRAETTAATKDTPTTPRGEKSHNKRSKSPENSSPRRRPHNSSNNLGASSGGSPKRRGGGKSPSRQKKDAAPTKHRSPRKPKQLADAAVNAATTDRDFCDAERECSASAGTGAESSPRYVSPKGNTTHLQLDLGNGIWMGDMPVFSLLDENSLLGGESDCDDNGNDDDADDDADDDNVNRKPNSNLPDENKNTTPSSPQGSQDVFFKPWGSNNDKGSDDDDEASPKEGSRSPIAKAVKALKYTKPSMSGASKYMGKMSSNFQQRLGLSPQHQQMKDDDDLDSQLL